MFGASFFSCNYYHADFFEAGGGILPIVAAPGSGGMSLKSGMGIF